MDLDQLTTDSPQMAAFIADQVSKSTAKLHGQVAQLQLQQGQSKNRTRGAPKSSAQHTKKMDSKKTTKGRSGPKAADAAKGTSNGNKTTGNKQQKKKTMRFKNNNAQRK
jgi:hypothetical protein